MAFLHAPNLSPIEFELLGGEVSLPVVGGPANVWPNGTVLPKKRRKESPEVESKPLFSS
jgi:hypothetical protein